MSGLVWVQTVCKVSADDTSRQRSKHCSAENRPHSTPLQSGVDSDQLPLKKSSDLGLHCFYLACVWETIINVLVLYF